MNRPTNSSSPLLDALNLEIHYGGIAAVKGVSFSVMQGEMVCLLGANGAGKTSTLKALARMINSTGEIRYAGEKINQLPSHVLINKGLALVPEGRGIFARLTIAENLTMGAYHRNDKAEIAADVERIFTMLPRLKEREKQVAGTLSGGEQQMLAMGRAMMAKPKILLLDEPSMGLAPLLVELIFDIIKKLNEEGTTILLVEQNALMALSIAHRGYVLQTGEIVLADDAKKLMKNEDVQKTYLGVE